MAMDRARGPQRGLPPPPIPERPEMGMTSARTTWKCGHLRLGVRSAATGVTNISSISNQGYLIYIDIYRDIDVHITSQIICVTFFWEFSGTGPGFFLWEGGGCWLAASCNTPPPKVNGGSPPERHPGLVQHLAIDLKGRHQPVAQRGDYHISKIKRN